MGRPRSGVVTYLLLVAFRVFNVFLIQSQFDPDEYWQQLEPAYCVVFGDSRNECAGLTWEWKRTPPSTEVNSLADLIHVGMEGPVRSYMSIVPTLLFYSTIKFLKVDLPWMVSRGPVFLNAILVAAPTDWAVWYLSRWLEFPSERRERELGVSTEWWGLYCSLTSWFAAYALSRTYSNSLETVLLALSLCLVSPVSQMKTVLRKVLLSHTLNWSRNYSESLILRKPQPRDTVHIERVLLSSLVD